MASSRGRLFIITHTDLDGEAAAASYMRIAGARPDDVIIYFTEPYNLHESVDEVAEEVVEGDTVAIMDIGFNRDSTPRALEALKGIVERGARVEWYDHHVWDPRDAEQITKAGVKLFLDRSTCGAGVVIRYASKLYGVEPDDFLRRLESAVCSADLWTWRDPLAPKLMRASGSSNGPSKVRWKQNMVMKFYSGILWDDELQARLLDYLSSELRNSTGDLMTLQVAESGDCRVAVVLRRTELPSDSVMGSMLTSRTNASIAAMVKRKGLGLVSVSLRSRGGADVQVIAKELGGGGHPRAAGASMRVNAVVYLLSFIWPRLLTRTVARRLLGLAIKLGACGESQADEGEGQAPMSY
ncbi:MAG: DHH family phosphoesterase [Acidilobus sp.]